MKISRCMAIWTLSLSSSMSTKRLWMRLKLAKHRFSLCDNVPNRFVSFPDSPQFGKFRCEEVNISEGFHFLKCVWYLWSASSFWARRAIALSAVYVFLWVLERFWGAIPSASVFPMVPLPWRQRLRVDFCTGRRIWVLTFLKAHSSGYSECRYEIFLTWWDETSERHLYGRFEGLRSGKIGCSPIIVINVSSFDFMYIVIRLEICSRTSIWMWVFCTMFFWGMGGGGGGGRRAASSLNIKYPPKCCLCTHFL